MTIGVIVSTYNNPAWLERTLRGFLRQTRKADEILVADDGSGEETRRLVERYAKEMPIVHVWHEDDGFRKTKILNDALRVAKSDFLVFTDQDCVPREDFLAAHEHFAQRGFFLSGGNVKLPMSVSRAISLDDVDSGRAFSLHWLRAHGFTAGRAWLKFVRPGTLSRFLNAITPAGAGWNGMNAGGWREDLLSVNGFDERMKYGGEDRELGERLVNKGLRPKRIRYGVVTLHLDHARPYANQDAWKANDAIRRTTRATRAVWTPHGVVKGPAPDSGCVVS